MGIIAWRPAPLPVVIGYAGTLVGLAFCDVFIWIRSSAWPGAGVLNALGLGLGVHDGLFCGAHVQPGQRRFHPAILFGGLAHCSSSYR